MYDWVKVTLEEYKSLRAESLQAIQGQQSALRLGLLAVGFLVGTAITMTEVSPAFFFLAYVELAFFAPLVISYFTLNWGSELHRMIRAGNYIAALEKEINQKLGVNALNWEQGLREGGQLRVNYIASLLLFLVLGIMCTIAGNYILHSVTVKGVPAELQNFLIVIKNIKLIVPGILLVTIFGVGYRLYRAAKYCPELRIVVKQTRRKKL